MFHVLVSLLLSVVTITALYGARLDRVIEAAKIRQASEVTQPAAFHEQVAFVGAAVVTIYDSDGNRRASWFAQWRPELWTEEPERLLFLVSDGDPTSYALALGDPATNSLWQLTDDLKYYDVAFVRRIIGERVIERGVCIPTAAETNIVFGDMCELTRLPAQGVTRWSERTVQLRAGDFAVTPHGDVTFKGLIVHPSRGFVTNLFPSPSRRWVAVVESQPHDSKARYRIAPDGSGLILLETTPLSSDRLATEYQRGYPISPDGRWHVVGSGARDHEGLGGGKLALMPAYSEEVDYDIRIEYLARVWWAPDSVMYAFPLQTGGDNNQGNQGFGVADIGGNKWVLVVGTRVGALGWFDGYFHFTRTDCCRDAH